MVSNLCFEPCASIGVVIDEDRDIIILFHR